MSQSPVVTLKGIIIPVEWDKNGNPKAVALAADDEQEYRISPGNQKGRSLMQRLQCRVGITGTRQRVENTEHSNVIKVTEYQILEDNQTKKQLAPDVNE